MSTRRRPIARTLRIALLGVTVVLAAIGAIGLAALYDARQEHEDRLSATAALEVAAANMLASAVALEANLTRPASAETTPFVARAARELDRNGGDVRGLAGEDPVSRALSRRMSGARHAARALAVRPDDGAARARAASRLTAVRDATRLLALRQGVLREASRDDTRRRTRAAVIAIVLGAGLAFVAVLGLLTLLIRSMRRPLDELVDATHRMASGDREVRVEAGGPRELAALGESFNVMSADLALAGAQVESQRRRLATIIESLGDGLVICDAGDVVIANNPRATQLVSHLRVGAAAHAPASPLPALADALAGEVSIEIEGATLAVTAARLGGPDAGVVWTLRDITERARLEQAKSDFVATASHELRSPLTSIKGFIELLESTENANLTARQREFIKIALQSTDRLVDLVNDLLDVARIESGQYEIQPRSCDLRETLEEVGALMAPRLDDKHQRLMVEISEPRPPALVDPARMRQIVTNLLTNAHQYTGEHGTITLRLDADARATRIVVTDTGRGMSPEDVRHIFDRFYRGASSDRRSPGTGLGLPIVKSLVELHGGTIDVRSAVGVGTTFAISLPSAPGGPLSHAPPSRLAARRVLIVDDEPSLAALIARQLEPLEMHTVQAHSGREALERLRSEHFDAMTLDVLMPGMNGFDVLETIRADPRLRGLPVIFVSVSSTLSRLDGEWAVAKPIDRQRLSDVLHSAIQANRSRVLVLAPDELRIELAPALAGLGVEYRWESNAERAASAGADELFEVALVHASMSEALKLVESAALRGRRGERSLILFSTAEHEGLGSGVGMQVFPLAQAIEALRTTLGNDMGAPGGR